MAKIEYMLYPASERLAALADFLRNAEAVHYRVSLLPDGDATKASRLAEAEADLLAKQKEYKQLQAEAEKEA